MTLIMGAALLVVQEALEMMVSPASRICSFTPRTTILISSSKGGTVRITFLAPLARWCAKASRVLNRPVASTTISTPWAPQSRFWGWAPCSTGISRPLTQIVPSPARHPPEKGPWMLSYLSRWARVLASAISLMATTSIWGFPSSSRKRVLPIRPKPLMPILVFSMGMWVRGSVDVLVRLVGGSDQSPALHMPKAHFQTDVPIGFELFRQDELFYRQVFFGRLKVLADGDHIHAGLPE